MENKKEPTKKADQICGHCGGILRYYLGSWSCMMCGRDMEHQCGRCVHPKSELKKTA